MHTIVGRPLTAYISESLSTALFLSFLTVRWNRFCTFYNLYLWQLLAGGSDQLLSSLHLNRDPAAYTFTNQGGDWRVPAINDKKLFKDVEQALKSMGVGADEANTLWRVVAAVLHLVSVL